MEDCVVFWWIRPQTLPNMYLLTHTSHKASQFEVFVNGGLCGVLVWAVTHGWLSFGFPAGHLSPRLWPVACGCSLVKKSDLSLDLRLVLRQWSGISTCHSLCMKRSSLLHEWTLCYLRSESLGPLSLQCADGLIRPLISPTASASTDMWHFHVNCTC